MTVNEAAARIEDMFDAQMDEHQIHSALEDLQEELIGAEALETMKAERFKAYQESHKWLYPEVYGPVERPASQCQILTPRQVMETVLDILQKHAEATSRATIAQILARNGDES